MKEKPETAYGSFSAQPTFPQVYPASLRLNLWIFLDTEIHTFDPESTVGHCPGRN